jgi:asparagine synthase (glutamine-hydrolysing)
MIGGYVYRRFDEDLGSRIEGRLGDSFVRTAVWDCGYLFHDRPFPGESASLLVADDVIALSQDLLVGAGPDGEYRRLDLDRDFAARFRKREAGALDAISSDFRMAVALRRGGETTLFLASHRAGSGRIYHHTTGSGLVFSSDLRFLLGVVGCETSPLGIYSILKYGAVPEPLTISESVRAVPPSHCAAYELRTGAERTAPYFRLRFDCEREPQGARDEASILDPVKETLRRSSRFVRSLEPAILLSGGIDSSLYGCYLGESAGGPIRGFYCAFGDRDPELEFAERIARRTGAVLEVARMDAPDALGALEDAVRLTDHPFADFSSLPIAFLLGFARSKLGGRSPIVECNGGDDCFGFPDLESESKSALKHRFPAALKRRLAAILGRLDHWKWRSREGAIARLSALADVHEASRLDYFLVLAPIAYLRLSARREWDERLGREMEAVFSACGEDYGRLSYRARTTIRQLIHVNSRRWAAKALSVGESLGIRVVYPYVWREVLRVQGKVPWDSKVKDGVVKWPLKRLLEEFMPGEFIYRRKSGFVPPFATWLTQERFNRMAREVLLDPGAEVSRVANPKVLEELLGDAAEGRSLRHSVLNFLWGALFTEMWIREHGRRKQVGPTRGSRSPT